MITLTNGTLLIAEPFLKDPSFARSVVLICKYTPESGTFGFALDKLLVTTLDEFISDMEGFSIPVYQGGPVQTDTLHYLHQYPEYFEDSVEVTENVFWGGDFGKLKQLIRDNIIDHKKIKFFLGYSGWSKGQLENELEEKTWITVAADPALIFETKATSVWNAALIKLGGKYKMMIHYPTDPQLN